MEAGFRFAPDPSLTAARTAATPDGRNDAGRTSRATRAPDDLRIGSARTTATAASSGPPPASAAVGRAQSTNARPAPDDPKADGSGDGSVEGAEANGPSAIAAAVRADSATRPSTTRIAPARVEVRIGRVTVDVHPAPPAAPIAPPVVVRTMPSAQPAFAPSRHYLRMD